MFKSVEYAGFDGHPDLRQLAERATAVLSGVIKDWRDEVQVTWRPGATGSGTELELTLSLSLPNAAATATGRLRSEDFRTGEEGELRWNLREVWLDLLDTLIARMAANREESFSEPIEA